MKVVRFIYKYSVRLQRQTLDHVIKCHSGCWTFGARRLQRCRPLLRPLKSSWHCARWQWLWIDLPWQ
eukprot:7633641-Karenia_brevis.AAC.1